jgi:hypothetical protein
LNTTMMGCAVGQKLRDSFNRDHWRGVLSEKNVYVHTVRWPGESLAVIAKWYTGDVKNWRILANDNPTINPRSISVGDRIEIQEHLLTTHEAMPRSFVVSHTQVSPRKSKGSGPPRQLPEAENEKLELYGPKE